MLITWWCDSTFARLYFCILLWCGIVIGDINSCCVVTDPSYSDNCKHTHTHTHTYIYIYIYIYTYIHIYTHTRARACVHNKSVKAKYQGFVSYKSVMMVLIRLQISNWILVFCIWAKIRANLALLLRFFDHQNPLSACLCGFSSVTSLSFLTCIYCKCSECVTSYLISLCMLRPAVPSPHSNYSRTRISAFTFFGNYFNNDSVPTF